MTDLASDTEAAVKHNIAYGMPIADKFDTGPCLDRRTTPGTIASRTGWKYGDGNRASDHETVPDRAGSYARGTEAARAENERMGYGRKQAEVPGDTQLLALLSELVTIARDLRSHMAAINAILTAAQQEAVEYPRIP